MTLEMYLKISKLSSGVFCIEIETLAVNYQ